MPDHHLNPHAGQSYIVRLYRRAPAEEPGRRSYDGLDLVGVVEDTQARKRTGFHNIEELWAILSGIAQSVRKG